MAEQGYAVVWVPQFRLQAVLRGEAAQRHAFALVDDRKRQSMVLEVNHAARCFGVGEGVPLVQALAGCPQLEVRRPDLLAEETAERLLLAAALDQVPRVERSGLGRITLDLQTLDPPRWVEMGQALRRALAVQRLHGVVGLGETASLARIAAHAVETGRGRADAGVWHLPPQQRLQALDQLPLRVATQDALLLERMESWGVASLGQFARFSVDSVAARLGPEGMRLWLELNGRDATPLQTVQPRRRFVEFHSLQDEVHATLDSVEPMLFFLRRFIERLVAQMESAGQVAGELQLRLWLADGQELPGAVRLPEPTCREEVLYRVLQGYLNRQPPWTAPLEAFELELIAVDPGQVQRGLFETALKNPWRFAETLDRLAGIVGHERVGSPRVNDSHRPEDCRLEDLPKELPPVSEEGRRGPPVCGPLLRRWRPPERARVRLHVTEGHPLQVESSRLQGSIEQWRGPWHGSGDWWHEGRQWRRAEWDVVVQGGLYRLVQTGEGHWWVEGCYD